MAAYQPSNGSEGECFIESWCNRCARDAGFRDTDYEGDPALGCQILADTLAYNISDPKYPKEWISDEHGPRCTAFTIRSNNANKMRKHDSIYFPFQPEKEVKCRFN